MHSVMYFFFFCTAIVCPGSNRDIFGPETRAPVSDKTNRFGNNASKAQTLGGHGQDENLQEFQQITGTVSPKHHALRSYISAPSDFYSFFFRFQALEREEPKKLKKRRKPAKGLPQLNNDDETDYEALFAKAFYQ